MSRSIDHLVLPVESLTLARSRLAGLGFTVAPDARHPFGTGNCCVFFRNGTYLEPLATIEQSAAESAAADGVAFVERLTRFVGQRGEGFAMLALRSEDAERTRRELESAGLSAGPVFRFSRSAAMPDGSEQEIGVALAFAKADAAPEATFFACQRINTDALWNEAFVSHPNGVEGVSGVTAVADDPYGFDGLLMAATGSSEVGATAGGIEVNVNGSRVSVVTPVEFTARYGLEAPPTRGGLLFAAFDLIATDLDRAIGYAGPTAFRHAGRIIVPPSRGLGAAIAFGAAGNG